MARAGSSSILQILPRGRARFYWEFCKWRGVASETRLDAARQGRAPRDRAPALLTSGCNGFESRVSSSEGAGPADPRRPGRRPGVCPTNTNSASITVAALPILGSLLQEHSCPKQQLL